MSDPIAADEQVVETEKGANPDVQNDAGDTALDWALKRNHQALVKLLKQHIQHE